MPMKLSKDELIHLFRSVFVPKPDETSIAILVDVPDDIVQDNPAWKLRREMAVNWQHNLSESPSPFPNVTTIFYPNVHHNNANLPENGYVTDINPADLNAKILKQHGNLRSFSQTMDEVALFVALTELSATAPLKLAAPIHNFRAVTMPGFTAEMISSLRLNYEIVNDRIMTIKNIIDPAIALEIRFLVNSSEKYAMHFDVRHRQSTASSGRFPDMGKAGNLPGGECYIVPYEGELDEKSETSGILPIQFDDEIVLYEIDQNSVVNVLTDGPVARSEKEYLSREPAYGNMAEIGFGILREFGIKPTNNILLDEKLGLHVAFGRSDHFGGAVGIKNFSSPDQAIHIDRIFIPETQPQISVESVIAQLPSGETIEIIKNDAYLVFN